ncbi:MAG: MarR family winged helix-turn-helix transcriptional regulator [Holosporaceae bacterium]|jgi:DNA-binding MarR family transcriptional regulator|nr:MarR family winged helix-turn-helix transcriptional regulator [Holosporaceae bacterium]
MKENYLEAVSLIERLHRLFLEVIKYELEGLKIADINNVQALVLYNLGNEQISIGELTARGCYLGSNVSYNLQKMISNGYIDHAVSKHDKRSCVIKLSAKGAAFRKKLDAVLDRHVATLKTSDSGDVANLIATLKNLEQFWGSATSHRTRFSGSSKKFLR